MAFIEVNGLSFSYLSMGQHVPVLNDISLSIEKGEMIAIQGPSGSGKSTLFYILGGLLQFHSGKVIIDNNDLSKMSNDKLAVFRNRKIGFIFQQFHLLPKANVLENILLPTHYPFEIANPNEKEREKAKELAVTLGIDERLEHLPNQLSGGQQQRVAIARSLIRDAEILLADEPTGNLDSKSSEQIMNLLKELNDQGKTILIITHDKDVSQQCSRVFHLKDGKITDIENLKKRAKSPHSQNDTELPAKRRTIRFRNLGHSAVAYINVGLAMFPLAWQNLNRNRVRSALTMLGITIGVAALLAMITVGQFTKRKILDSYVELGINTLVFNGYPNWQLKATDIVSTVYRFFDWERDLQPLKQIFPQIRLMSPLLTSWNGKVNFAGRSVEKDVQVIGIGQDGLEITNRELLLGRFFTPYHIERKSAVCVVGFEIAENLFTNINPLGQVLHINLGESAIACRVIGVLNSKISNDEWAKPNLQVVIPFTFFQAVSGNWWSSQIHKVLISLNGGEDIEGSGKSIRAFFERKYGNSGEFRVDSDSVLIAQMQKFLNLFTIMLAVIALISLAIGGIGIANMMLVSVSERFREIGLRKAIGATDFSVRIQFLVESIVICGIAGVVGLLVGVIGYEGVIFGASKFVSKLEFEWVFDISAVALALISIVLVGVFSGLIPALKAEKLQVIEALRNE